MRCKVTLSLSIAALVVFAIVRYLFLPDSGMKENKEAGNVTIEALQQNEPQAEPFATAPAAVIAAVNSLLLDGGEDPTLVMLYINGDNDVQGSDTDNKIAQRNLSTYIPALVTRAQEGAANPNVITYMVLDWPGKENSYLYKLDQRGKTECTFRTDYTCGGRYVLGQTVFEFPEDMGDPANLTKFISETMAAVPNAKNVVLTLMGHGGGWSPNLLAGQPLGHGGKPGNGDGELGGLLWDNYTGEGKLGNSLSTLDLSKALKDAQDVTQRKIDLLYLDSCLMGMWEVAYQVKDYTNYLFASESWSWTSFAYDKHLADIEESDTAEIIGSKWITNEAEVLSGGTYPFTYSLLDLAKLPELTTGLDGLATQLVNSLSTSGNKEKIRTAFAATGCFDSNADGLIKVSDPISTTDIDNYCDIDSFVGQLKLKFAGNNEIANTVQSIQSALGKIVITQNFECGTPTGYSTQKWCWPHLGGISIYTPFGQNDWKRGAYGQLEAAKATKWGQLIETYWNTVDIPASPKCPVEGCSLPEGPLATENLVYLPLVQR